MNRYSLALLFILFACTLGFSQQWPTVPGKLRIATDSIYLPIGVQNGIVITADSTLNHIYRNNQVYNVFQMYPNSYYQFMREIYKLECNCNERLLKDTLESAPFYAYVELINQAFPLNIKEEFEISDLKIYPLPAATRIYFEAKEKIEKAEIMDLSGKLVYKTENPTEYLDVSGLRTGQYLLHLTSKAKTYKRLILKE